MSSRLQAAGLIALPVVALAAGLWVGNKADFTPKDPVHESIPVTIPVSALPDWVQDPIPDFTQYTVVDERKEAFFDYLFPRIVMANYSVTRLRERVEALRDQESLDEAEQEWLESQRTRLRVSESLDDAGFFDALLAKLDVIPPSLMLAQAANESSWGTSRFALEGNNLFGQWCFTEGCGMVPGRRAEGLSHEVATFDHTYASVRSYITNLNRHQAYEELRRVREQQRQQGDLPDGLSLAEGLESYSERGQAYVREIQSMINFNQLSDYDYQFGELLAESNPTDSLTELVDDYDARFGAPTETPGN